VVASPSSVGEIDGSTVLSFGSIDYTGSDKLSMTVLSSLVGIFPRPDALRFERTCRESVDNFIINAC